MRLKTSTIVQALVFTTAVAVVIGFGCKRNKSGTPFTTPTPSPSPTGAPDTTLKAAIIGDFGVAGPTLASVTQLVRSWNPRIIVTTGDNNYPLGGADTIDNNIGQYFSEFIFPYKGRFGSGGSGQNRFFPSMGNHDWDTARGQPYLDYFQLPGNERYYDFVSGPVHFFVLSSDPREYDGIRFDSPQARWFRDRAAASTVRFQVVVMHHPPFSSSQNGSTSQMNWDYKGAGIDVVLSGHDHTYERVVKNGLTYIVQGASGYSLYDFRAPVAGSQVRHNSENGALLLEATQSSMTLKFITISNRLVDTVQIP